MSQRPSSPLVRVIISNKIGQILLGRTRADLPQNFFRLPFIDVLFRVWARSFFSNSATLVSA